MTNVLKKQPLTKNIKTSSNSNIVSCLDVKSQSRINEDKDAVALKAFRDILEYIGEDPDREGLVETPDRMLRAFGEYFAGYAQDARDLLQKTFGEIDGFKGPISVENIDFISHCEHHMAPFEGTVSITYLPNERVVGLSKLARVVDIYAKRLQIQERMTSQIANAIYDVLKPAGVKVVVSASHFCLNHRGANKKSSKMLTSQILGKID